MSIGVVSEVLFISLVMIRVVATVASPLSLLGPYFDEVIVYFQ